MWYSREVPSKPTPSLVDYIHLQSGLIYKMPDELGLFTVCQPVGVGHDVGLNGKRFTIVGLRLDGLEIGKLFNLRQDILYEVVESKITLTIG